MKHEHEGAAEQTLHRLERRLSRDPDNFHDVYRELNSLRRKDPDHFSQQLREINDKLHRDGYLPNLEITQDDDGLLVAKKSANPKGEAVVGREESRHHKRHHGMHHGRHHEDERLHPEQSEARIPNGEHRQLIDEALRLAGVPVTAANESAVNLIVQRESGWNRNAINLTDSNARAGHPSQGLMQTIPGTFHQWAINGHNADITDPLSNLIAGIRYATHRYGSLQNVPGVRAVASGRSYVGY